MSRIGKKPITVPAGVEVKIDGHTVTVKGPKGTLTRTLNEEIGIQMEGNEILVTRPNDDIKNRSLHGLNRTLIHNMVVGVTEGFEKKLEIQGVGYNAQMQGKNLKLALGFSHPVIVTPPEGITISTPSSVVIVVSGCDKEKVGQIALGASLNLTKAKVSVTPVNTSAVRLVRPAQQSKTGGKELCVKMQAEMRLFAVICVFVKRSPVLPLARVSMFSVPWLTSTLRSSMMKLA